MKTEFNIEHPTFNAQHPRRRACQHIWMFDVGSWVLDVSPFAL
jgi:hypothetical protein